MLKILTGAAAAALLAAAIPSSAGAAPAGPMAGVQADQSNVQDVQYRRSYRWNRGYRYYGPRYYGPYAYARPDPYYYRRYYYPGPHVQVGPFGFGIW